MAIFLTWLPDVLRGAGLTVRTESGWEKRARSSGGFAANPLGVSWHHTASSASAANQVGLMCLHDKWAPIANIAVALDGTVYVMAAGATNTSGKGNALKMSRGTIPANCANTMSVGMECLNNGTGEAWPETQVDAAFACVLAINKQLGNAPDDVFTHHFYTLHDPSNLAGQARKIDPATAASVQGKFRPRALNANGSWSNDDIRAECRQRANAKPQPSPLDPALATKPKPEPDSPASPPSRYTVQPSDGWFAVARGCGCSLDAVLAANNATVNTVIHAGQELNCPK